MSQPERVPTGTPEQLRRIRAGDSLVRRQSELVLLAPGRDEDASSWTAPEWRDRLEAGLLRAVDLAVASVALVVLLPVLILMAILIRLDSPGPILYRQLRVGVDTRTARDRRRRRRALADEEDRRTGRDRRTPEDLGGRPFWIYKFRTMEVNAESETGPVWATGEDRRTTRLGRILRRHRLDEIPQFWNVLRGEMSVVGPRPERPAFFQKLRTEIDAYTRRQTVLPGITGWAQVNRGYDQSFADVEDKLEYDLEYVERRSVSFQLRIMFETVFVMAGRRQPFSDLGRSRN